MSEWICPHGIGPGGARGDCEACNADIGGRAHPIELTGAERKAEVLALLNEPSAYRIDDIHGRLEALVGRPVWTHEFATDLALAAEAESWVHPVDLRAHVIRTAEALADGKPVVVIDPERLS